MPSAEDIKRRIEAGIPDARAEVEDLTGGGDHFRATVLSKGGTQDYFELFRAFAGREPRVEPMLEDRGLIGGE